MMSFLMYYGKYEIIWIESNEFKLFRTTYKKLQPNFFCSFFRGLEMPSKWHTHVKKLLKTLHNTLL